jgi:hypothetical protein
VLSADVLEAVQLLVRTPSVNPSIAPDEAHGESAVAQAACEWLMGHGVRAWLEEAAPGRPNAVAEIDGGNGIVMVEADGVIAPIRVSGEAALRLLLNGADVTSSLIVVAEDVRELAAKLVSGLPPSVAVVGAGRKGEAFARMAAERVANA